MNEHFFSNVDSKQGEKKALVQLAAERGLGNTFVIMILEQFCLILYLKCFSLQISGYQPSSILDLENFYTSSNL